MINNRVVVHRVMTMLKVIFDENIEVTSNITKFIIIHSKRSIFYAIRLYLRHSIMSAH